MKELYNAPELRLIGFLSKEKMAAFADVDLDDFLGGNGGGISDNVQPAPGDVDVNVGGK